MAKRPAEEFGNEADALKSGERPLKLEDGDEIEFEDEFEDEYESEEDMFEAGVDGRPDEERETEERRGTWYSPEALCDCLPLLYFNCPDLLQMPWMWTSRLSYLAAISWGKARRYHQILLRMKCSMPSVPHGHACLST